MDNANITKYYVTENIKREIYCDNEFNIKDVDTANFIRHNITNIKNDDILLFSLVKKIRSKAEFIKDIIKYEFVYSNPDIQINNVNDFIIQTKKELNRYQGIIGGFNMEDNQWLDCVDGGRFKLKPGKNGIYNSIEKEACFDNDLKWFLKNFVEHMKKFIKSTEINISYKIVDDDDNELCWILFLF